MPRAKFTSHTHASGFTQIHSSLKVSRPFRFQTNDERRNDDVGDEGDTLTEEEKNVISDRVCKQPYDYYVVMDLEGQGKLQRSVQCCRRIARQTAMHTVVICLSSWS